MSIDPKNPTPLYKQIYDDILSKIYSGELDVGDSIGTQHELTATYDVSLITVKKAISKLISEGVLYARVGRGTFVNKKPAGINFSEHKTIAYVLKNLDDPFYQSMVSNIERQLSIHGCNMLLFSSDQNKQKETEQIKKFINMGINGLIIGSMSEDEYTDSLFRQLHNENFPYVMVSYNNNPDICYIGSNHLQGGFLATEHLINLGYKHIGYVQSSTNDFVGQRREEGYKRALEKHQIEIKKDYIYQFDSNEDIFQSGFDFGVKFCQTKNRPEALFIYNDLSALGFMNAVTKHGLKVPEDIAIVGFDDIPAGRKAYIPLTTIHQPSDKIAEYAVDLILRKIDGEDINLRRLVKPELVIRESCGYTPV